MVSEIKDFEQRKENLIKKGKELGFITYEELAEELKGLEIGSDLLDELYNALMENDISVVSESDLDDGSDEDDGGDLEDILKDNNIAKELTINDPVRMYLKEIGKISLLSLAEETELSERIANGDEEAMSIDTEYIRAMQYGMPPISGWGLGIDRFLQFLTNSDNIRDVVLYPLMKPRAAEESEE